MRPIGCPGFVEVVREVEDVAWTDPLDHLPRTEVQRPSLLLVETSERALSHLVVDEREPVPFRGPDQTGSSCLLDDGIHEVPLDVRERRAFLRRDVSSKDRGRGQEGEGVFREPPERRAMNVAAFPGRRAWRAPPGPATIRLAPGGALRLDHPADHRRDEERSTLGELHDHRVRLVREPSPHRRDEVSRLVEIEGGNVIVVALVQPLDGWSSSTSSRRIAATTVTNREPSREDADHLLTTPSDRSSAHWQSSSNRTAGRFRVPRASNRAASAPGACAPPRGDRSPRGRRGSDGGTAARSAAPATRARGIR